MGTAGAETLSRADVTWLHAEAPTNHFVVTSLAVLDGAPDVDRLKAVLRARIALHPRLRQVVAEPATPLTPPRWIAAPDFDLDAHIHRVSLRAGKSELAAFIGDLAGQPLDFGRPLWSLHAVDGLHGGGALVSRFHHSLGDGQAMVRMLLSLTDQTAEGWKRRPRGGRRAVAARRDGRSSVARLVDELPYAGRLARTAVAGMGTLARLTLLDPDRPTPLRGRLSLLKAVSWTEPIPLELVKRIAHGSGTTVNDVLVSAIAGGLGSYLRHAGTDTRGLRIRAMVPVNLRQADDVSMQGNRFSLVFLEMPVGVIDPWERLMRVKIEMDRIKASLEPGAGWLLVQGLGFLPTALEHTVSNFYAAKASLVLTNVIGPAHELFTAGRRIKEMTFWEPESGGLGVGVSIFSYAGRVTVGAVSDRHLVGDPERLTAEVARAIAGLAEQTC
ncbi:MAG TPA: wax ester/triacylglycerol synthase family O-acyltransferase [Candidatus Dormibacteraeota bacterium]|nr:wax ester/triacylglycerol synthase family O-acyltransferase [Candidatus Dormibacteraeota bacterium]